MTRTDKARAWSVAGYIVSLIVWAMVFAAFGLLVGFPPLLTGFLNFCIVFAFCISPWYHQYMDWLEDVALKYLKKQHVGE